MLLKSLPNRRNVTAEGNTDISEEEIKTYLGEYEYELPPKSPFIVREGFMKRDPGVFKSWRENYAIITTDRYDFILKELLNVLLDSYISSIMRLKRSHVLLLI